MADVLSTVNATLQSGAAASGNGSLLDCGGLTLGSLQISGTFVATINFESTENDTDWVSVYAINQTTRVASQSATTTGLFTVPLAGNSQFRARISGYASGQVTVKIKALAGASPGLTITSTSSGSAQTTTRAAIASVDGAPISGTALSFSGRTLYAEFDYSTTGAPASVSVRAAIEGSVDGTNWDQLVRFPDQTNTTSAVRVVRLGNAPVGIEAPLSASALGTASTLGALTDTVVPPQLRAVTMLQTLSGGTSPTVTINIRMVVQ